jgi:hypothetical protein
MAVAGIDPFKLADELSKRGLDWADKDAAFYALDETKKDILAECMMSINEDLTQGKLEAKARTSNTWKTHQVKLAEARKAMNTAKVNYTVFQSYIELIRSKEATTRAEIGMGSMIP